MRNLLSHGFGGTSQIALPGLSQKQSADFVAQGNANIAKRRGLKLASTHANDLVHGNKIYSDGHNSFSNIPVASSVPSSVPGQLPASVPTPAPGQLPASVTGTPPVDLNPQYDINPIEDTTPATPRRSLHTNFTSAADQQKQIVGDINRTTHSNSGVNVTPFSQDMSDLGDFLFPDNSRQYLQSSYNQYDDYLASQPKLTDTISHYFGFDQ